MCSKCCAASLQVKQQFNFGIIRKVTMPVFVLENRFEFLVKTPHTSSVELSFQQAFLQTALQYFSFKFFMSFLVL